MLRGRRFALVEDDEFMGSAIEQRLRLEGAEVVWLKQAVRALPAIRTPRAPIDAVICDIRLPDGSGEEIYGALCRTHAPPPFLFITGQGDIDQAVRLLRAGAQDYMTKPFEMRTFLDRLSHLLRARPNDPFEPLGVSRVAEETARRCAEFAAQDCPVLIRGAGGTGKVRLAQRLHDLSDRAYAPFISLTRSAEDQTTVNVSDLETAIERAGEGTLYLMKVEALNQEAQAVLLVRLGDGFRLIASCGPGFSPETSPFRADLFSRLASAEIVLPPLAEHPDDALWLAQRIFQAVNARRAVPLRGLSALAEAAILAHDWPGNGRELRTRLVRAVGAATGEWLFPADLFPERVAEGETLAPLADIREAAERRHILLALEQANGHAGEAARLLGISRTTLWEKMQKLGI
ncbi:sigma-54-dependent transcriptional regulator [Rubellimicrobium roseum]|uniref:DNA-binding transcriptional regulator NtrC n=1 Tax=Rubellimicrobium roseum TaxID=687525 RepID=A0A5C4N970_9RHOB|nr:response regulator [Rubellimicrobium roseum]TNC67244.1 sigma-54-dependent Fis family transcriptional regulator [Rubellimicrobium roseum]